MSGVTTVTAQPLAHPARARSGQQSMGSLIGRASRVVAPCALVLATVVLADQLRDLFPGGGLFLLLLLPVLLAAVTLGPASGGLALGLGAAGSLLMAFMGDHPWLTQGTDALRIVLYLLVGGLIVLVVPAVERASGRQPSMPAGELPNTLIEPLTERESEVLGLAASGLSIGAIGANLCVSPNTVKSHLAHAYAKLGAHNRAEAVAAALHSGTIDRSVVTARAPQITQGMTRPAFRLPLPRS
jgi:DNA-binding CsgD family transcriptional regulator